MQVFLFKAISNHGDTIVLDPIKQFYAGNLAQILLKPRSEFKLNDSISLSVDVLDTNDMDMNKLFYFTYGIPSKKWKVIQSSDTHPPKWKKHISYRLIDYRNMSGGGGGMIFRIPLSDNSFSKLKSISYGFEYIPAFYEITNGSEVIILPCTGFTTHISQGACIRNFTFDSKKEYTINIRPMDSSGNYCRQSKNFTFSFDHKDYDWKR